MLRDLIHATLFALVSSILGVHLSAAIEMFTSGAPLLPTLGPWLIMTPLIAVATMLTSFLSTRIKRLRARLGVEWIFTFLALNIIGLSMIALSAKFVTATLISHTQDQTLVAPLAALGITLGCAAIILGLTLSASSVHHQLTRYSLKITVPIILLTMGGALTLSLGDAVKILSKAELIWAGALIFIACLTSTLTYTRISMTPRLALFICLINIALATQGLIAYHHTPNARHLLADAQGLTPRIAQITHRLSDYDHDGFGVWLGGGDCDDDAPHIHPDALDIADNNVDEDCDGVDRRSLPYDQSHSKSGFTDHVATSKQAHLKPHSHDEPWNLLIITIDALRADRVSGINNKSDLTPHLDKLTESGLIFERAYTPCADTRYSIPPLFSGRALPDLSLDWAGRYLVMNPQHEGTTGADVHSKLQTHPGLQTHPRLQTYPTLFQKLKSKGYQTAVYTAHALTDGMWYGLERGVDHYVGLKGATLRNRSSRSITEAGIKQLRRWHDDTPKAGWSMWLHYLDPHEPYLRHAQHDLGPSPSARYDGEVAAVDASIGRLLRELNRTGQAQRTLIVVTADHGEEFGEHGKRYHGKQLFDESIRVPFLIHVPGASRVVISESVSTLDMVWTVGELLNLDDTSTPSPRSHASRLTGAPAPPHRPVMVYRVHNQRPNLLSLAIIKDPYKLIFDVRQRRARLYNLAEDPHERHELRQHKPLIYKKLLRQARDAVSQFREKIYAQLRARHISSQPPPQLNAQDHIMLSPQLKFLGARAQVVKLGDRTLREVSAWVQPLGRVDRSIRFKTRWRDASNEITRTLPLSPLAGSYPVTRWRPNEVIKLISWERMPDTQARHVELMMTQKNTKPLIIPIPLSTSTSESTP